MADVDALDDGCVSLFVTAPQDADRQIWQGLDLAGEASNAVEIVVDVDHGGDVGRLAPLVNARISMSVESVRFHHRLQQWRRLRDEEQRAFKRDRAGVHRANPRRLREFAALRAAALRHRPQSVGK
ncbi:hypothetical protein [Bradyrhizobium elkanii]|uniref:hypothetical protein n=1 Tax=Bradyrhizobium elkanii TaxID=29448 RepID=UPI0012FD8A6E|nr:hypothetical protein [Bradyrhizobium elkanii]WLA83217.1 hypothetical protein QNJ99_02415 [Bradyrhizobium elkanii]